MLSVDMVCIIGGHGRMFMVYKLGHGDFRSPISAHWLQSGCGADRVVVQPPAPRASTKISQSRRRPLLEPSPG